MAWRYMVILAAIFIWKIAFTDNTSAYLSDVAEEINQIHVGQNVTQIEEQFPGTDSTPIYENPQYDKMVWISNDAYGEYESNVDCYVRVYVSISNYDIGKAVQLENIDRENWVYNEADGYYYYKHRLIKGQKTTPLFTGVQISSDKVDDTYQDKLSEFCINVYEESVQASGFSDYTQAWSIF